MTPTDTTPVSLSGSGEHPNSVPKTGNFIREYYARLKAPYVGFQHFVRQRILTEGERLRDCQRELLLCGRDKFRTISLKEKLLRHQSAIDEMESGLNWAASKIRNLDAESEDKIVFIFRHSNADTEWRMAPGIPQTPDAAFSA